jgi:mannose-1-phosphate guanylyltransferase
MVDPNAWAVIMAGGSGTRFWPLSRRNRPKQFLDIVGDDSMLQQTWKRSVEVVGDPARVLLVTSAQYAELTREQLPELPAGNLLAEPEARNTAPCLAWAAAELQQRDPEAVMIVFPADHVIRDVEGLRLSVQAACAAAGRGHLVTFGVPPRYPETGYGYVEVGARQELDDQLDVPVHDVVAFREKPDQPTARQYVAAGSFLWNSGMFVWRADRLMQAMDEHLPEASTASRRMVEAADDAARAAAYAGMPRTSIDYGIMERAEGVACVRAQFDWSDVGSWEALQELLDGDDDGNVVRGRVVALDARDNLVHVPEGTVALLGVERIAVVRAGDVLLVASLQHSQDIKALRERIADAGLDDLL